MTRLCSRSRRGFTLVELLVVLFVCLFLLGMIVACNDRSRVASNGVKCASNLRQIGQAILLYSNENRGAYPKTRATSGMVVTPTWGTGVTASNPFADDGPAPNDVSACLFLLLRTQDITPHVFTCPSSSADFDTFGGGTALNRSNFTDIKKNLSYSYQNPFISDGASASVEMMFKTCGGPSAELALAADMNPGLTGDGKNVLAVNVGMNAKDMKQGNSSNHDGDGQNVLYGDGHVEWQSNPFVGVKRDNIYTVFNGEGGNAPVLTASPFDANDSILLPTDD
jgi:prepilin-type N-terminal cleavage/methylation domain-containing protein/prepilin-type processing-associated H-X9-DG protein